MHLDGKLIDSPLPERVHLLQENFLYWIKLEYPNLAVPGTWIQARPSIVLPLLEKRTFDETGFRVDENRASSLFNVPTLIRTPNCIHRNLRNQAYRGLGGITGDHVYVSYHGRGRKVAFTRLDVDIKKVIMVSSFGVSKEWVARCAEMPAVYVGEGLVCTCSK
jgi:hypothetical protein